MGVYTTYDEKRDQLRQNLKECLEQARELLNEDIWGYDEMRNGYALDLYQTIKNARDAV
ncbi:hypothetical protein [Priestia megaterium]|jgi:uncharacterized coiled-coil DUF342 family protein|uniref:hypothetical protein n=1 Tax=Priestia megaterium TaxID=1404 RepID=UPI0015D4B9CD|nr:hypothetical protein [Priestia megaterium]